MKRRTRNRVRGGGGPGSECEIMREMLLRRCKTTTNHLQSLCCTCMLLMGTFVATMSHIHHISPTLGPFGVHMWGMPKTTGFGGETVWKHFKLGFTRSWHVFQVLSSHTYLYFARRTNWSAFLLDFGGILTASFGSKMAWNGCIWATYNRILHKLCVGTIVYTPQNENSICAAVNDSWVASLDAHEVVTMFPPLDLPQKLQKEQQTSSVGRWWSPAPRHPSWAWCLLFRNTLASKYKWVNVIFGHVNLGCTYTVVWGQVFYDKTSLKCVVAKNWIYYFRFVVLL